MRGYFLKLFIIKCVEVSSSLFWRHLLSRFPSTIGVAVLNDSVRNGKRCDHRTKSPEQRTRSPPHRRVNNKNTEMFFANITSSNVLQCFSNFLIGRWVISTSRLNALLRFHLKPINVIISYDPMIPYLEIGFPLRCFQRLSIPDIATGRCPWQDSP